MRKSANHGSDLASLITVCTLALMIASPASAGLGDSVNSVLDDQLTMHARLNVISVSNYVIHELASPVGVVVREYVSANGEVFAVSWHGPFMPDMHRLLSTRFGPYLVEVQKHSTRNLGHSVLNIRTPSLVVENVGHTRAYTGRAYDPSLLPAGISIDDIR
jgi:Protein of unknown function (DUF2844)